MCTHFWLILGSYFFFSVFLYINILDLFCYDLTSATMLLNIWLTFKGIL